MRAIRSRGAAPGLERGEQRRRGRIDEVAEEVDLPAVDVAAHSAPGITSTPSLIAGRRGLAHPRPCRDRSRRSWRARAKAAASTNSLGESKPSDAVLWVWRVNHMRGRRCAPGVPAFASRGCRAKVRVTSPLAPLSLATPPEADTLD